MAKTGKKRTDPHNQKLPVSRGSHHAGPVVVFRHQHCTEKDLRHKKDFKIPSQVLRPFYSCTTEGIVAGSITAWCRTDKRVWMAESAEHYAELKSLTESRSIASGERPMAIQQLSLFSIVVREEHLLMERKLRGRDKELLPAGHSGSQPLHLEFRLFSFY